MFGKFEFIYSTKKIFWLFFGLYDKYDLSSLKSNTCHIIRQCGSDPLTKILRSQHHFGCIKYSLDLKIVGILEIRKRCGAGGKLPTLLVKLIVEAVDICAVELRDKLLVSFDEILKCLQINKGDNFKK